MSASLASRLWRGAMWYLAKPAMWMSEIQLHHTVQSPGSAVGTKATKSDCWLRKRMTQQSRLQLDSSDSTECMQPAVPNIHCPLLADCVYVGSWPSAPKVSENSKQFKVIKGLANEYTDTCFQQSIVSATLGVKIQETFQIGQMFWPMKRTSFSALNLPSSSLNVNADLNGNRPRKGCQTTWKAFFSLLLILDLKRRFNPRRRGLSLCSHVTFS